MVIKIFEVQDTQFVFDCELSFLFDDESKTYWKNNFEDNFEGFIEFLKVDYSKSSLLKYYLLSSKAEIEHDIEGECKNLIIKGFSPAAFLLSYIFEYGELGFGKDKSKTKKYEAIAADMGHPQAQWNIGITRVSNNDISGVKWILKAALTGFEPAIDYIESNSTLFRLSDKSAQIFERKYDF